MKTLKGLTLLCILLGFTAIARAQVITGKDTGPVDGYFDCIGEWLHGTVTYHYQYRLDDPENPNDNPGNRYMVNWVSQGGVLIGETTGRVFRWNFVNMDNEQIWPPEETNGSWTGTMIWNVNVVGTGKDAPNIKVKLVDQWTILPTGEFKVSMWNYSEKCHD
jgi:hypothetical protein